MLLPRWWHITCSPVVCIYCFFHRPQTLLCLWRNACRVSGPITALQWWWLIGKCIFFFFSCLLNAALHSLYILITISVEYRRPHRMTPCAWFLNSPFWISNCFLDDLHSLGPQLSYCALCFLLHLQMYRCPPLPSPNKQLLTTCCSVTPLNVSSTVRKSWALVMLCYF